MLDRIAKEPPRWDEATREIDMTMELMSMYGNADFSLHAE